MGHLKLRFLLPALAVLAPLSSGTEITSIFTTTFPTTAVVTSSSAIAGCSVSPSAQINCIDGFYNTYGAVWKETCSATITGGSAILVSAALSLRACMSACAVRPACSATSYDGSMCILFAGDVNITPGGQVQAAMRYEPTASPCVSTWLVTETGTSTSIWESVYTVTSSPTPIVSPTPTSSSESVASMSLSPSDTPSGTPPPSLTPSVQVTTPSPTPSSRPVIQSSSFSTSSPVASPPAQSSSTPLINTSTAVPSVSSSVIIPSIPSLVISSVTPSGSLISPPSGSDSLPSSSILNESPSGILPPSLSSSVSLAMSTATGPSVPSASSSGSSLASPSITVTQSASGISSTLPSTTESAGNTPSSSIYTVTTTQIHTIISCAAAVTKCPAHQQTTYLTTETLTYTTTVCPEETSPSGHSSGAPIGIPQPETTPTATFLPEQATETSLAPAHLTSSIVYVTEIDVITACPPSIHNCNAGDKSTYTTSKTVAGYTTTYPVAMTDSPFVSVAETASVPVIPVIPASSLAVAQSLIPSPASNRTLAFSHPPTMSTGKFSASSSGSSQRATQGTTMNTVSWQGPSVTVSAPGSLFAAGASQMARFSTPLVVVLLSMIFVL